MPTIILNNLTHEAGNACRTWGDLLETLDRDLAGTGHIVTAARFDGVEEPAFRDPSVTAREIGAVDRLEVQSGTPRDLVQRTLDEAIDAVEDLCGGAMKMSEAFRGYDVEEARQELARFAEGCFTLVAIIRAVALSQRLDLNEIACDGATASSVVSVLLDHIEALIAAQQASDWLTVADIVEYDVEPSLRSWRRLLDTLRAVTA